MSQVRLVAALGLLELAADPAEAEDLRAEAQRLGGQVLAPLVPPGQAPLRIDRVKGALVLVLADAPAIPGGPAS